MLKMMLDKNIIYVLMGGAAVCGIISKLIVSVTLKRLVRAAGNMNKSTHPLMRLVRAKFEHACMVSEKVENVRVFVDKYLYEYRVLHIRLHSWRRMERAASGVCLLLGILGMGLAYGVYGMQDLVLEVGAAGAGLAIFVYLIHLTTDENFRLEAVRNYMVDYLENVCLHRYEKAKQDIQEPVRLHPRTEVPSPLTSPELKPPAMPKPYDEPKRHDEPKPYDEPKRHEVPELYDESKRHEVPELYNEPKSYDVPEAVTLPAISTHEIRQNQNTVQASEEKTRKEKKENKKNSRSRPGTF